MNKLITAIKNKEISRAALINSKKSYESQLTNEKSKEKIIDLKLSIAMVDVLLNKYDDMVS